MRPLLIRKSFNVAYLQAMPNKPLELPLAIARNFARDMRAFHAEPNAIKRDEIAARQLSALRALQGPREKQLRLSDVKQMFEEMKDRA